MANYLLFDADCRVCANVADEVRRIAGDRLDTLPLDHPRMAEIVARHDPSGGRKPRLVIVTDQRTRVLSGKAMSLALTKTLGPRRALRIVRALNGALNEGDPTGRRSFLRTVGVSAAALGGFGATANSAFAAENTDQVTLTTADVARLRGEALANRQYRAALEATQAHGYNGAMSESVGIDLGGGDRLLFTFVAHATRPEREAAVISYTRVNGVERTAVETVAGDAEIVAGSAKLSDALTVGTLGSDGMIAPRGPGEYFNCITFCVGAQCGVPASRCRAIPFLYGMLACMVAVCGSKVRSCHQVCKTRW